MVMKENTGHTFHIPVMGLGYTIDTPVKIARFGISSVVSIIQDHLIEQMREFYCNKVGEKYEPITTDDVDYRAKRITLYLDLLQRIVDSQLEKLRNEPFEEGYDIVKYFKLLPETSHLKKQYAAMLHLQGSAKDEAQRKLRQEIIAGAIDVNIMTKIDNVNYSKTGETLPPEFCDAVAALRGFANSSLSSSVVFSAGLNPRLFSFLDKYPDFFPDENGNIRKKIMLKVSDYRSALIQGKFLAKKGLWVSEFRIESGLNCGGHAFPTEGYLLGPILDEFKNKRNELKKELLDICNQVLAEKKCAVIPETTNLLISVQGGIGTSAEDKFLREYYNVDSTGWGSPFLLVPEATNVDDETLKRLINAKAEDYYLSHSSPLGIPFNNFRNSTSENQRKARIEKERPGSPCYKKYLAFNTEFTEKPICTSSREYQNLKIKALLKSDTPKEKLIEQINDIMEKDCLCEGLSSSVLLKNHLPVAHKLEAVTICPGPNLAYFSNVFSLEQMIGHIYGRLNILNSLCRPHMFVNELKMYVDYLKKEIEKNISSLNDKQVKYFSSFKKNLLDGIDYYKRNIAQILTNETEDFKHKFNEEIEKMGKLINSFYFSAEPKAV